LWKILNQKKLKYIELSFRIIAINIKSVINLIYCWSLASKFKKIVSFKSYLSLLTSSGSILLVFSHFPNVNNKFIFIKKSKNCCTKSSAHSSWPCTIEAKIIYCQVYSFSFLGHILFTLWTSSTHVCAQEKEAGAGVALAKLTRKQGGDLMGVRWT